MVLTLTVMQGDWCSVSNGASTGASFVRTSISSFYFTKGDPKRRTNLTLTLCLIGLEVLTNFAMKLGKSEDASKYGAMVTTTKAAFQNELFNATKGCYEDGYPISQASDNCVTTITHFHTRVP